MLESPVQRMTQSSRRELNKIKQKAKKRMEERKGSSKKVKQETVIKLGSKEK